MACLVPFFYACAFCFPRGDDFDEATRAMFFLDLPGGLYEIGREWLTWSGRYSYHFLAVFLGKAAESRFLYGAVCASVICCYWSGFILAAKNAGCRMPMQIGILLLMCLLTAHQCLPNFYLLTDALTSALQGAAWLVFLAFMLGLWSERSCGNRVSAWRNALLAGIFAIGIYEHAALATVITAFVFLLCAWLFCDVDNKFHMRALWRDRFVGKFMKLALCLCGALLFSFLAPGNMRRNLVRGVDPDMQLCRLANCVDDWQNALAAFWATPWPYMIIIPAVLAAASASNLPTQKYWRIKTGTSIICGYLIFSFSVICMHALSDVPFPSEPKLQASLDFFTAITFGSMLFIALAGKIPLTLAYGALLPIFFILCLYSANFRQTLANAANGQMVLLADFMTERNDRLLKVEKETQSRSRLPPSGLLGEIYFPDARKIGNKPDLPAVTVQPFPWQVFPVHMFEPLASEHDVWPNHWAARFYGIGSIKTIQNENISGGTPLHIPVQLEECLLSARQIILPCDYIINHWLILETTSGTGVSVFRAAGSNPKRLVPMPLQKMWQNALADLNTFDCSFASRFKGMFSSAQNMVPVPLGMVSSLQDAEPIFVSRDGYIYYKLYPDIKRSGDSHDIQRKRANMPGS